MYTVVFADDEIELRQAILQRIDWAGLGFSVVADAENGVEALEAVEQYEPDLLITDMIGLMTGMSYEGVAAGEIHPEVKERLCALVESVSVPTLAEGGINATNFRAFKDTKVNILVIGTSIDNMVKKAAQDAVREFLAM